MEAPEKLYVDTEDRLSDSILYGFTEKRKDDDIEYIRKDAFIEKACNAYCKVCGHYPHTVPTYICRQACDYYTDFKIQIEKCLNTE